MCRLCQVFDELDQADVNLELRVANGANRHLINNVRLWIYSVYRKFLLFIYDISPSTLEKKLCDKAKARLEEELRRMNIKPDDKPKS